MQVGGKDDITTPVMFRDAAGRKQWRKLGRDGISMDQ